MAKKRVSSRRSSAGATADLAPKQQRSLQSQEKLIATAEQLLARHGANNFTIADLSEAAGVSVGGIYRRFEDREALIQAVQVRLNERMDEEFSRFEARCALGTAVLAERVPMLVSGMSELIRRHAPVLKAIVDASWVDPVVARRGRAVFLDHERRFTTLLLAHRLEIKHPDPDRAAIFCCNCIWENVASHFGFGNRVLTEKTGWNHLVADLQRFCYAFLIVELPRNFLDHAGGR